MELEVESDRLVASRDEDKWNANVASFHEWINGKDFKKDWASTGVIAGEKTLQGISINSGIAERTIEMIFALLR